ncbi:MAG: HNH endonuclease [Alphaproteobacteria bacterium]
MVAVLQLDAAGVPHRWIGVEDAAVYSAKGLVLWEIGAPITTLRGGINARTGARSSMDVKPVIALTGGSWCAQEFRTPAPERRLIFSRERFRCSYCSQVFPESQLTVDHIVPESRGGAYSYMNLLAACRSCNGKKGARTPEEAGMLPIWAPYVPNRAEAFLLSNRRVLADQYEYLAAQLPKHSRLLLQ